MSDASLLLTALAVATIGMGALALTIAAHWRQIFRARSLPAVSRLLLRLSGALLLVASLALCALADPLMMAALVWPMLLMVSAGIVAAALTLHARCTSRS